MQVPTFAYEKRLSRIETLRLAITYIGFMTEILSGTPPNEPNRPNELAYPPSTSHHHHHIPIQREFIPPYNHQWTKTKRRAKIDAKNVGPSYLLGLRHGRKSIDELRKWNNNKIIESNRTKVKVLIDYKWNIWISSARPAANSMKDQKCFFFC